MPKIRTQHFSSVYVVRLKYDLCIYAQIRIIKIKTKRETKKKECVVMKKFSKEFTIFRILMVRRLCMSNTCSPVAFSISYSYLELCREHFSFLWFHRCVCICIKEVVPTRCTTLALHSQYSNVEMFSTRMNFAFLSGTLTFHTSTQRYCDLKWKTVSILGKWWTKHCCADSTNIVVNNTSSYKPKIRNINWGNWLNS